MTAAPFPTERTDERRPLLVGRDRERELLERHLAASLAGRGRLILIGGEAGIGKTALATALGRDAEAQGALVLIGRCYDLTETPPYGPWVDLFRHYPAADDLPPLPPQLAQIGTAGPVASHDALFARVQDFLVAVAAKRPLVLFLDDLHWADPASLDLLRFLAREFTQAAILLLATYREDELTRRHPLARLLPLLVRETAAERLSLRSLDRAAIRDLVDGRYALAEEDAARLVAYLVERGEGNPFFLGELLRALEDEGLLEATAEGWRLRDLSQARLPSLVLQVIDSRLARLPDEAQALLTIAAVIGQEVPLTLWQTVSGVPEDALLATIEAASDARLLQASGDGTSAYFVHALIREALYAALLPPRRRVWHRRIGDALAQTAAPDPDAVAYHFRQGGDARTAEWLIRAGDRAQRAYAWLTAAERFEAALELLEEHGAPAQERGWLLYRVARMRRYVAVQEGIGYLDDALRLAVEAHDPALHAYALADRGLLYSIAGQTQRGIDDMKAGLAELEALPPGSHAAVRLWVADALPADDQPSTDCSADTAAVNSRRGTLALSLASNGYLAEARVLAEATIAEAGETAARELLGSAADAHRTLAYIHAALGEPDQARRAFARSREAYRVIDHYVQAGASTMVELHSVVLRYQTENLADRQALAASIARVWARAGGARPAYSPRLAYLPLLLLEGHWDEAQAVAQEVFARTDWIDMAHAWSTMARLAWYQGNRDLAWRLIRERLPDGPATDPGAIPFFQGPTLLRLAATMAADAGDFPLAHDWLATHDRWLAWTGAILGKAEAALTWSVYHRAQGDLTAAWRTAEEGLAHATEPRQPLALIVAHRLLGELATQQRRHESAAAHLDAALALTDACAAPFDRALTLISLAELHVATSGQHLRDEIAELLAEARMIVEPLRAAPTLARIDRLTASLATVAQPTAPHDDLTPREIDVLRLVAQGLSNAQVAEQLYLSPRTVNTHLTAIYGKLGLPSRAAAIRYAIDRGLR
ncbi:MAG: AAA family ATPase [Thermomicrobiales bacterium]